MMFFGADSVCVCQWETPEPSYMLGNLEILGVSHHIELVRVMQDERTGRLRAWRASDDPAGLTPDNAANVQRLENLFDFCGANSLATVQVPGFPGDWVAWVTPYYA